MKLNELLEVYDGSTVKIKLLLNRRLDTEIVVDTHNTDELDALVEAFGENKIMSFHSIGCGAVSVTLE